MAAERRAAVMVRWQEVMDPPRAGEDTDTWTVDRMAEHYAWAVGRLNAAGYSAGPGDVLVVIAGPFTRPGETKPRGEIVASVLYEPHDMARVEALTVMFQSGQADESQDPPRWPAGSDRGLTAAYEAGRVCRVGPAPYWPGQVP